MALDDSYLYSLENKYSDNVLIGNWYEARVTKQIHSMAKARHDCLRAESTYRGDFKPAENYLTTDESRLNFTVNRWEFKKCNIPFCQQTTVGAADMLTTNDVFYKLSPKQSKEKLKPKNCNFTEVIKGDAEGKAASERPMKMNFGLIDAKLCVDKMNKMYRYDVSVYKTDFTPHRLPPFNRPTRAQAHTGLLTGDED